MATKKGKSTGRSTVYIIIGLLSLTLLLLMVALGRSLKGRRWGWNSVFNRSSRMARATMWSTHPMRNEISNVTVYRDSVRKAVLYGNNIESINDDGTVVRQQKETPRKAVSAPGSSNLSSSKMSHVDDWIKTKRREAPVSHQSSIRISDISTKGHRNKANPSAKNAVVARQSISQANFVARPYALNPMALQTNANVQKSISAHPYNSPHYQFRNYWN